MAKEKNQLDERICPECGRAFIFRDQWAYKLIKNKRVVNYCSWTCMRKNERNGEGVEDKLQELRGAVKREKRSM